MSDRFTAMIHQRLPKVVILLLIIGGIGLSAAILWLGMKERKTLNAALPLLRAQKQVMESQANEIKRLQQSQPLTEMDVAAMKATIENTAQHFQLSQAITKLDLTPNKQAYLTLSPAVFNDVIKWLAQLQTIAHLRVDSCQIEYLNQPGMVKATLVLTKL